MMWNSSADLTAGPVVIPAVQWTVGTLYNDARAQNLGWGSAVELPVVLKLLEHIAAGTITAEQAAAAFAPVLQDLARFDDKVAELDHLFAD